MDLAAKNPWPANTVTRGLPYPASRGHSKPTCTALAPTTGQSVHANDGNGSRVTGAMLDFIAFLHSLGRKQSEDLDAAYFLRAFLHSHGGTGSRSVHRPTLLDLADSSAAL